MEISRRAPGEASLVLEGRELLDLIQVEGSEEEYEDILAELDAWLQQRAQPPRLVVQYREGLFEGVQSDQVAEVILIEDDPHDEPPLALHRQRAVADPAAVEAALSAAQRRLRLAAKEART